MGDDGRGGPDSHVVCSHCLREFEQDYARERREHPYQPPLREEFCGPFSWVTDYVMGSAIFCGLFFLVVALVELLHWLTGGWVPQMIDWSQPPPRPTPHVRHFRDR